jgi:ATP-dependent RNA helicase MSS116
MFNLARRGPASISRVFTAVSRIPSTRPSTLSLSVPSFTKPALEARWLHVSTQLRNQAAALRENSGNDQHKIVTQFQELVDHGMVHENVVNEITKGMGHHTMTEVQSQTINEALSGVDM